MSPPASPGTAVREQLLLKELDDLRRQLEEPEELLRALRSGEVDAFVVPEPSGEKIYALRSADPLYRLMIEQMREGAATLSADGTIVYCNYCFAGLTRTPRERLLGSAVWPFLPGESRGAFENLLRAAGEREGEGHRGELTLRAADGTRTPVYASVNVLPVDGAPVFCVVVTDLTEQEKNREVVAAAELARSIIDQAAEAIVVCDAAGTVVRASRAAHRLCGCNPLHQPFERVLPLRVRPGGGAGPFALGPTLGGETVAGVEVTLPGPEGHAEELLASAAPLRDSGGGVIGCVVTLTDIGRQKRAEEALRDADRRKDEFLAVLAHELRNPLAPLVNAVKVLKMTGDAPAGAGVLDLLERQLGHMVRLVDDLLDVARIREGKFELRREEVGLAELLSRAAEAAGPFVRSRGHRLTVSLPPESLRLHADPLRLTQVLSNLLNNAAKYTEPGGRIELSAGRDGDGVAIRVSDTGIGIAPADLGKVFDLFGQVEGSALRSQGGLGIGLTLVRSLVGLHGGTVAVASPGPGRGTEFTVRLPLYEPAGGATAEGDRNAGAAPALAAGRRVLVVDDNADAADILALYLRAVGHDARATYSAADALEAARAHAPEVVLLDIGLPGADGCEVARQLRGLPQTAGALLVALTGLSQEEDRRRSLDAGFDHHLVKPTKPDVLARLVAEAPRPNG